VDKYVKLSNQLGGVVAQQAAELLKAFQAQRDFLLLTTKTKKPGPDETSAYQKLLEPTTKALTAVQGVKEANRKSPFFTQLSAVAEGIMVLAWVTVEARTAKHVEEAFGSAQFFGNRVLKEQKDKYEDLLRQAVLVLTEQTGTPNRWNGFNLSTAYSRVSSSTPNSTLPTA
jgi:adenylyl cyclase-associated protein